MSLPQKFLIWTLRGLIAIALLYFLLLAAIFVFLQRDPDELVARYIAPAASRAGIEFSIGGVDVTLLPLPAIAFSNVTAKGPDFQASAAWLQARPTLKTILNGDFLPGSIRILYPQIVARLDCSIKDPLRLAEMFSGDAGRTIPLPASLHLEISRGEAAIRASDAVFGLADLNINAEIAKNGAISGVFGIGAASVFEKGAMLASLENFQLGGSSNIHKFATQTHGARMKGLLRLSGILRGARFQCQLDSSKSGWNGSANIFGRLALDGAEPSFQLSGRAMRLAGGHEIVLRGIDWRLGADWGSADLALDLPTGGDWRLGGTFTAQRLSLTQWFGFARNLAPGLQITLDNITGASMRFALSAKSLKAENILASCSGATFKGSGGVADFARPVVALHLAAPEANLGLGLPEAVGKSPRAPRFPHPPLTPMPGEPLKAGETGIGYDINLSAKLLRYGSLNIRNAAVRIYPGKLDKQTRLQDVLLDGVASLYGGKATGTCIVGGDKEPLFHIKAKAEKVNGAAISKDMPLLPMRQGLWQASATVMSSGKTLDDFLASLRGNISASATNATLAATGASRGFKNLSASASLRGGAWDGRRLAINGQWKAAARDAVFNVNCELSGRTYFGENGLSFRDLPGSARASLEKLPKLGQIGIRGKFSAETAKNSLEIAEGVIDLLGVAIHADAKVDAAKAQASGHLRLDARNPAAPLARVGLQAVKYPPQLAPLKLTANFLAMENVFNLAKIEASLGKHKVTGGLDCDFRGNAPVFKADLGLDQLHLPDFIDARASAKPDWDFRFLTTFSASGKLKIGHLSGWDFRVAIFHTPFKLADGKAELAPISAIFYGAPLHASLKADFRNGLDFDSTIKIEAFDLGKAAQAQKIPAALSGQASMEGAAGARLGRHGKLAQALNGKWSFNVKNGSWASIGKKGAGKPTTFSHAGASGTIAQGKVQSKDFRLLGNGLEVDGEGSLNLVSQNIDCVFQVNMKGLPDFPVYIYGPLKKPETAIGAGKMILNAVSGVTSGFVNAVGGLLRSAWGIFTH